MGDEQRMKYPCYECKMDNGRCHLPEINIICPKMDEYEKTELITKLRNSLRKHYGIKGEFKRYEKQKQRPHHLHFSPSKRGEKLR